MTPQKTIAIFAAYLLILGLGVVFAPGMMMALILLPPPVDADYLFIGFLLFVLSYYYFRIARADALDLIQATVIGRCGVFGITLIWVLAGALAPNYLVFLAVDLAGALWTAQALRRAGHAAFKLA